MCKPCALGMEGFENRRVVRVAPAVGDSLPCFSVKATCRGLQQVSPFHHELGWFPGLECRLACYVDRPAHVPN